MYILFLISLSMQGIHRTKSDKNQNVEGSPSVCYTALLYWQQPCGRQLGCLYTHSKCIPWAIKHLISGPVRALVTETARKLAGWAVLPAKDLYLTRMTLLFLGFRPYVVCDAHASAHWQTVRWLSGFYKQKKMFYGAGNHRQGKEIIIEQIDNCPISLLISP